MTHWSNGPLLPLVQWSIGPLVHYCYFLRVGYLIPSCSSRFLYFVASK